MCTYMYFFRNWLLRPKADITKIVILIKGASACTLSKRLCIESLLVLYIDKENGPSTFHISIKIINSFVAFLVIELFIE